MLKLLFKDYYIMRPSEQVKGAGLKSLVELSSITGQSEQTLINWYKKKPDLFDVVLLGAITRKWFEKLSKIKEGKL